MFMDHRRQLILRRLARDGSIRVSELAQEWAVNPMTIRRDLAELEGRGQLRRVYGGALPMGGSDGSGPRIGLMVPDTERYYRAVVSGAERAARQLGARLVVATHFYLEELERERLEKLVSLHLDGLVLATRALQPPGAVTAGDLPGWTGDRGVATISDQGVESIIDRMRCPVVLVERQLPWRSAGVNPSVVRSSHDRGALMGVQHLRDLGHDRVVAAMEVSPTVVGINRGLQEARDRFGIDIDVIEVEGLPGPSEVDAVADQVLARGHTAILAHPDPLGADLVDRFTAAGRSVGDEIHLVSYNDVTATEAAIPLTAVAPAKEELGYEAVRMALHQIDTSTPTAVQHLTLVPRLVVRDSAPQPESATGGS